MSQKITKFVQRKFNTDLAGDLGLSGRQRISVIFKIDKNGDVVGVRARAPHPRLVKEATRVVNLLPKMKPGKQRGKAVVDYLIKNGIDKQRIISNGYSKKYTITLNHFAGVAWIVGHPMRELINLWRVL